MTYLGATAKFVWLAHNNKKTEWTYECATPDQAKTLCREFTKYRRVKKDPTLGTVGIRLKGRNLIITKAIAQILPNGS